MVRFFLYYAIIKNNGDGIMSKIVFIGDSITAYMPYVFKGTIGNTGDEIKYFGVENIGVGSFMNYCWPKVDHENVNTYIMLIGTNNISRPDCDYDERESLEELIDKLKEFIVEIIKDDRAKLLVQSIYPTKYPERVDKIKTVNAELKKYCSEIGIEYLDLYSLLIDEKELFDKKYTDDGIHPNEPGYDIIATEINNKLNLDFSKRLTHKNK